MLSEEEIEAYIFGATGMGERKQFGSAETRQLGDSPGIPGDRFDVEQFEMGRNIELEHGGQDPETDVTHDEPMVAGTIASAHLNEIPDYYIRLFTIMEEKVGRTENG